VVRKCAEAPQQKEKDDEEEEFQLIDNPESSVRIDVIL
jgi:hypothetical protein